MTQKLEVPGTTKATFGATSVKCKLDGHVTEHY